MLAELPLRHDGWVGLDQPSAALAGCPCCVAGASEELRARDFAKALALPQRADQLAVVEMITPFGKVPVEHRHADLAGVRLARELRLREERRASAGSILCRGGLSAQAAPSARRSSVSSGVSRNNAARRPAVPAGGSA
jgi:hypothetical protein